VSNSLEPLITASGHNLFNEFIHSDHRATFINILLKDFLGHGSPKMARPDLRFVSSASRDVKKFVRKMYSHLQENKVFHHYQEFRLDCDSIDKPWNLANKIDNQIGHAFQLAESSCYKPQKNPWSEKLHLASLKVKFWKTALTERLTKVSQSAVLRNLAAEIWTTAPPLRSNTCPESGKRRHCGPKSPSPHPSRRRKRKRSLPNRVEVPPCTVHVLQRHQCGSRHQKY
jgi:hypothetical protein